MTLMERRRALMMVEKDEGILYRKVNWAFSGGNLDTMIPLCKTDIDFSVAMDVLTTTNPSSGDGSSYRLIRIIDTAVSAYTLAVFKNHNTDTTLSFRFMSKQISGGIGSTAPGRHRFVITHDKGSDKANIKYRKDDGATESVTLNASFVPSTNNLVLGQTSGVNQLPSGTLNNLTIYNRVLSSSEINSFLGL